MFFFELKLSNKLYLTFTTEKNVFGVIFKNIFKGHEMQKRCNLIRRELKGWWWVVKMFL